MTEDFDRLLALMSPPDKPLEAGNPDEWHAVEDRFGTELPKDYKDFINTYGTGYLGQFLWVYNPFSQSPSVNLLIRANKVLEVRRRLKNNVMGTASEDMYPFALYPDQDGLFPWAKTDNGDDLFWQTTGHPNGWPVVAVETRGPDIDYFQGTMTSFLASIIAGKSVSKVVPCDYLRGIPLFRPLIPREV